MTDRHASAAVETRSIGPTTLPLLRFDLRESAPRKSFLDNLPAVAYIGCMSTVDGPSERMEFLQGTLEVLILRSLQAGPNHAYGIGQFLELQSGNEFVVDNGSLYPALQRLLQRGWTTAQWKTSPNARRARYYRLTPLGRKQLVEESSKWRRFVEAMSRVLSPEA
jgi:PadR family transcriptional regulator, regulatory protein PadR